MKLSMVNSRTAAQTTNSHEPSRTLPLFDCRSQVQKQIEAQPPVVLATLAVKPTMTHAIRHCFENPGLDASQAASLMGIQEAQFSRIMSGTAHFPTNRYGELMDVMGNEAPLMWLANSRGYELRRIQTDVEQENERLRAELAQERHDREVEQRVYARVMLERR
jgi:plasmid maintenance system antidote protein VapI